MSVLDTCNEIITEKCNHILRIKINRPQKKNALTIAMYAAMADAIIQADEDSDIRVVFLQGTADCFTAGNDLQDFKITGRMARSGPQIRFWWPSAESKNPWWQR